MGSGSLMTRKSNGRRLGLALAIATLPAALPGLAAAVEAEVTVTGGPERLEKRP